MRLLRLRLASHGGDEGLLRVVGVGRLDGLVNNAGLAGAEDVPVEKLALADWNRRIATNLTSVFLTTKLVVSALGLWFLGIHKNFPFVRQGLTILFFLFLGVVGWHFYLALKMI